VSRNIYWNECATFQELLQSLKEARFVEKQDTNASGWLDRAKEMGSRYFLILRIRLPGEALQLRRLQQD
jgi:hypothetical protein